MHTYFAIKFKYLNLFIYLISLPGGDLRVGQGRLRRGREDAPQADRNHPGSQGKGGKVHFWCSFVFFFFAPPHFERMNGACHLLGGYRIREKP